MEPPKLPVVTSENYYDRDINMAYMSSSQFKAFRQCEAAALAELRGEYVPKATTALLVGGYIDAYFSGELPLFQAKHPEIFKRDGQLKAEYLHAQDVINRMEEDELYSLLMSGAKQVIRTGFIAGVPFKIKIDSLLNGPACEEIVRRFPRTAAALGLCDGAIVDQKAMKDMVPVWSAEDSCRIPFVEAWGYDLQGAIYQAIEGHMLPFMKTSGRTSSASTATSCTRAWAWRATSTSRKSCGAGRKKTCPSGAAAECGWVWIWPSRTITRRCPW